MDTSETLLAANTAILGLLTGVAAYFLRDLHTKFTDAVGEIRQLWIEFTRHETKADHRLGAHAEETRKLTGRVERVEDNLMRRQ